MIKSSKSGPGPTGPRTPRGKANSKHNALKHGVFSKVVVLKSESRAEFDALLSGFCDYFQPSGPFEEGLVETLAVTRWRQRRLLIAEAAEIQAGREFIEWDEEQRQLVEAGNILYANCNGGLARQIANTEALQTCLSLLAELKFRIEELGFNSEDDILFLSRLYGDYDVNHCEQNLYRTYLEC